uniref:AlNc14C377G11179 protein n=1 Tax=Albugo laibachii Nc14 TaxID=890382 RepID=F0WYC0_9STRA|nr:AlNc14C377G11179 [Albugo laibachii Nc14]|eukprot:CCA26472.1 AlNc14C377G11179 [Albugo laibachii Nc14]
MYQELQSDLQAKINKEDTTLALKELLKGEIEWIKRLIRVSELHLTRYEEKISGQATPSDDAAKKELDEEVKVNEEVYRQSVKRIQSMWGMITKSGESEMKKSMIQHARAFCGSAFKQVQSVLGQIRGLLKPRRVRVAPNQVNNNKSKQILRILQKKS